MKKALKIGGVVLGVAILLAGGYVYSLQKKIERGDLVKWEGKWYTKEQLRKIFPPQYYDVPAKNTPEEVYAKFREALLKNDIEGALNEMVPGKREKYKEIFSDKEKLEKYMRIPEVNKIKKGELSGNFADYTYFEENTKKDDIPYTVKFEKNSQGFWQVDSI